jgi:hypothetical protein
MSLVRQKPLTPLLARQSAQLPGSFPRVPPLPDLLLQPARHGLDVYVHLALTTATITLSPRREAPEGRVSDGARLWPIPLLRTHFDHIADKLHSLLTFPSSRGSWRRLPTSKMRVVDQFQRVLPL